MTNSLWPGLGYGILSFIFFGLYAVPRRYTESPTPQFLLIMGITISACTSISGLLFTERLAVSFPQIVLSYVSGFTLVYGNYLLYLRYRLRGSRESNTGKESLYNKASKT